MKKIFTSISMALCLAASSFNASAQQATQLSDAQKQEIQQKVLPVVFEQIKEQAGIDILGWAQPKLTADYLESLPIFNQLQGNSGLRADATPYSVQPDSIKLNVAALATLANMPGLTDFLGEELKITFDNYSSFEVPMIDGLVGRPVTVELPSTITVGQLATVQITNNASGLTLLDLDISATFYGVLSYDLLKLTMGLSSTAASSIDVNVDIQEGLHSVLGLANDFAGIPVSLPQLDYRISVDISRLTEMVFPMSLVSITDDTERTEANLGDATVALDFSKTFPINYINVTSYKEEGKEYNRFEFNMYQTNLGYTLQIDNYLCSDEEWTIFANTHRYNVVMSDNTVNVASVQSAAQSVIQNVVSQLANDGEVAPYTMNVTLTTDSNGDGMITNDDVALPVMDVNVTPYGPTVQTKSTTLAGATINILSYSYNEAGEASTTAVDLNAAIDDEDVVSLDVKMGDVVLGNAYFKSNIMDIVTSNEDIQLANVEVTPVKDGIYVSGTTAASYRIVSMSGATVANGTVSGDNAYISTSALAKGIYVIVVTENGESKAIKFAR